MMQKLTLEIDHVQLLRGFNGKDELTMFIECPEALNEMTKGCMLKNIPYTETFGDNLNVTIKITIGCGERLAKYLGVKIDETIKASR